MKRLYELTLALADGQLTAAEGAELDGLIAGDPLAQRRHLELLELEAALRASTAEGPSLLGEHTVKAVLRSIGDRPRARPLRRRLRSVVRRAPALGAVAACAGLVFLGYAAAERARLHPGRAGSFGYVHRADPRPRTLASRTESARSGVWVASPVRLRLGASAGVVQLELGGGAVLEARGPRLDGTLERRSDPGGGTSERLLIDAGTVAVTGEQEVMFVTPQVEVVTRARHAVVTVSAAGTQIDVHDGTALATPTGGSRWVEIGSRQSLLVGPGGAQAVQALPAVLFVGGSHFGRFPTDLLEAAVVRRLEADRFTVETVDEAALDRRMIEDKALVFISPSASDLLGARIRETGLAQAAVPIVCARPSLYADLGMTGPGRQGSFTSGATRVDIIEPGHPLAAGLAGPQQVTRAPGTLGWGYPGGGAVRIAVFPDWRKSERASIFAYERGAELATGGAHSPARRVGFFLHPDLGPYVTEAGWSLFDAAVRWATGTPPAR